MNENDKRRDSEEAARLFHLARENGADIFLDLNTGQELMTTRDPNRRKRREAADKTVDKAADQTIGETDGPRGATPIMDVLLAAFTEAEWRAEFPFPEVARVYVKGDAANYALACIADEENHVLSVYLTMPTPVVEGARAGIAEAITRANYGLRIGCFDMDYSDGELRFRVGIDIADGVLTEHMVASMLGACFHVCDQYYPAFLKIIFGRIDPAAAIAEVAP